MSCNVPCIVPGEDFQFQLNTPLVFPASSTLGETVCVPITVIGDVVQEANEVFQVVVTADNRNDVVNSLPVNITIIDDGDSECYNTCTHPHMFTLCHTS